MCEKYLHDRRHSCLLVLALQFLEQLRHFQFTTRWITILAKEDVRPFEATVQGFENVLVVANKTVKILLLICVLSL